MSEANSNYSKGHSAETNIKTDEERFQEMRERAFAMSRGEVVGDWEYTMAQAYALRYGSSALSGTVELSPAA